MFSYFLPPITNTRPALSVTLEEVYEMIISEKWAQTTRSLRSLRKGEQADFKRRQLPFVTFSGIFSARHSEHIVRHSGLMCFDFDHVGDEIAVRKLQQLLVADPTLNVQLAFRSPSGDGLKVVVECFSLTDNANKLIRWHNAQYAHIASYIEQKYNVKVDKTNDIARACFLCHDPKAYYNSQLKKSVLSVGDNSNPDGTRSVNQRSLSQRRTNGHARREVKNSVRNKNSEGVKSVESVERFSRSERANKSSPPVLGGVPEGGGGLLSVSSVKSVGDNHSEGVTSVKSVNQRSLSPWRENSVRDKKISVRDKKISVKDKEISVRDKTSVEEKTLEMALRRIELHHIDVTTHYHDWYRIGMALASHYGEAGRDYYHRISRFYPRYTPLETNQQYDRCLRYNTYRIRLGTLFYLLNI